MSDPGELAPPAPRAPAEGASSDLEIPGACRAIEAGWTTEADVEAARLAEDRAPGPGLLARLGLTEGQRSALRAPPFPAEVAEALRDPGRRAGGFVLLDRLGRGGMGDVWRAWDLRLARPVALKLLRRFEDPRSRACFEREARVLAALKLPGVPAIFELGEVSGAPFIAMELIEGETLAAARKPFDGAQGRPPPRRAAELIRDAALTVEAAHRAGIIHRDLKPGNLMLDREGRLFVTDFGLAKAMPPSDRPERSGGASGASDVAESKGPASSLTESAIFVGTPEYMPPEQARGSGDAGAVVDARSDVYALGACLFDLLTGRPPFTSKDRGEVIAQVLRDAPPRPGALAPATPEPLEAIVLRCLAKDPARRYPSAGGLADDLDRLLAGRPVAAAARRRALPLRAVGGLAASMLALVLLLESGFRTPPASEPVLLWRGDDEHSDVRAIATDGARIFAGTHYVQKRGHAVCVLPAGGGAMELVSIAPYGVAGIALAGDELFWTDPNSGRFDFSTRVYRTRKDGRGGAAVIYEGTDKPGGAPVEDACGLATDGRSLFVADEVGGWVVRMGFDGSGVERITPPRYAETFAAAHKNAIAVAEGEVFVADAGKESVIEPEVVAAPAAGGPLRQGSGQAWRRLWRGAPLVRPRGIAVGAGTVYVSDSGAGNAIWALPAEGGAPPRLLRAGRPFVDVSYLAVSGGALLVGDSGDALDARGDVTAEGRAAIWRIQLGAAAD